MDRFLYDDKKLITKKLVTLITKKLKKKLMDWFLYVNVLRHERVKFKISTIECPFIPSFI